MNDKKNLVLDLYLFLLSGKLVESKKDFAEKIGVHASTISNAFSGNDKYVTKGLLKKIQQTFPNLVDDNWQPISTTGNISSNGNDNINTTGGKVIVKTRSIEEIDARIKYLEERIKFYESQLNQKQIECDRLTRIIDNLTDK